MVKNKKFSDYVFAITTSIISGIMILMFTLNYNANKESRDLNKQAMEIDIKLQHRAIEFQKDIQEIVLKGTAREKFIKKNEDKINILNVSHAKTSTSLGYILNELEKINRKLNIQISLVKIANSKIGG